MAVDTRNKRASAIAIGLPWRGILPDPDGVIGAADRQQAAFLYVGILAAVPPVVIPPAPPVTAIIHSGAAVGGFGVRRLDDLNRNKRDVDVVVVIAMAMR